MDGAMKSDDEGRRLDPEALDRVLRLGGMDLLERLVAVAGDNVRSRIDELDAALSAIPPDLKLAQRACHSMKSSAAYLGLVEMREVAESMEGTARRALDGDREASVEVEAADELRRRRREIPGLLEAGLEALRREVASRR